MGQSGSRLHPGGKCALKQIAFGQLHVDAIDDRVRRARAERGYKAAARPLSGNLR